MTQQQAEFFEQACDYAGTECSVRDDYSGRGMFGRTTHAIVVPHTLDLLAAVVEYVRTLDFDEVDAIPLLTGLRQDEMGRDTVIY
jgi:hypothetical protein